MVLGERLANRIGDIVQGPTGPTRTHRRHLPHERASPLGEIGIGRRGRFHEFQ